MAAYEVRSTSSKHLSGFCQQCKKRWAVWQEPNGDHTCNFCHNKFHLHGRPASFRAADIHASLVKHFSPDYVREVLSTYDLTLTSKGATS